MLLELNNFEICRRIRKESEIPIIMITAKDQVIDKVMGLNLGANDYITKPFAIEELLARIRGVLRKNYKSKEQKNILETKDLKLNYKIHEVRVNQEIIKLTKKEYNLLYYLLKNNNIVLSREQIIHKVWGYDYLGDTNVVNVYIRYLRTKLDDRFKKTYISTIIGVEYIIKDK